MWYSGDARPLLPVARVAAAEVLRVACRFVVVASVPSHEDHAPQQLHRLDRRTLEAMFERATTRGDPLEQHFQRTTTRCDALEQHFQRTERCLGAQEEGFQRSATVFGTVLGLLLGPVRRA